MHIAEPRICAFSLFPTYAGDIRKFPNNKVLVLETIMRRAIEWAKRISFDVWRAILSKITSFHEAFKAVTLLKRIHVVFPNWLSFYASTCIVISRSSLQPGTARTWLVVWVKRFPTRHCHIFSAFSCACSRLAICPQCSPVMYCFPREHFRLKIVFNFFIYLDIVKTEMCAGKVLCLHNTRPQKQHFLIFSAVLCLK